MELQRGKCTVCGSRLANQSRWEGNYLGVEYRICWPCVNDGAHPRVLRWIEAQQKEKNDE